MTAHAEYTPDQVRESTTIFRHVFQAERDYLLSEYENSHEIGDNLYREITMAEMVVLDYGIAQ